MNRKFLITYSDGVQVVVSAPDRHKAKAMLATDLVNNYAASDFKSACNHAFVSCRLAPGERGARLKEWPDTGGAEGRKG
jgi:hypothetical protein